MGNQQSSSNPDASHGPAAQKLHAAAARELNPPQHNPRRRESIQTLSIKAKSAAPPSASFESAAAAVSVRPRDRPSSRGRANTLATATPTAHTAVANQLIDSLRERPASTEKMGNEQSRQKGHHTHVHGDPPPQQQLPPQQQRSTPPKQKPASPQATPPSPQTRPVAVPAQPRDDNYYSGSRGGPSSIDPADASIDYFIPASQFSRPPRLPLPIEEEVHTPGSPIISAVDLATPINPDEIDGVLPRKTSVLSSTTVEEDDLGEEFQGPQNVVTVPTLIEWEGPGERVYVTGTFAGWNRKFRLHRNGPSQKRDVLSAIVPIAPGTHHLKFIVDNDMRTSDKLPTAVDYTNILVNYLEVSLDDIQPPGTTVTAEEKKPDPVPVQDLPAPVGIYPPQTLPPTPELAPVKPPVLEPPKPKVPVASPRKYHQSIPRYLLDLDAPDESSRSARANRVLADAPTPPSLPMFLSKSILNGTTPMKDDSSVLIMPNHTVLNHLATSSIKDNILATSATTRYKQKFLTTIMYKPKNEDPDRVD
ncbi:carbohydrate-binding module family 48 protein [Amniculicola lignicola CBS 123094]|uniref:Carbohydrate-binding module family 48 protein n=1 Tax=Amniculicola lignicola CBS 123094 TaxID=1392246 RepID=A0A6A5WZE5_9PLEO|nr:carbohydrate-binding module family 48 protein [Amniculicola lignicola CBS 123094]